MKGWHQRTCIMRAGVIEARSSNRRREQLLMAMVAVAAEVTGPVPAAPTMVTA